uniref:Cyclin C-terminal domain-containing protein n=1 Tax=Spumella elongata TaxID=89044 RepID=A0A7S3MGE2_9STRA
MHVIHYEVHVPTGYHFLSRYLDLLHASDVTRQLAFYYAERNLQETTSLALPPSAFAAVCVYAALVQRDLHSEVMCSDLPTPDVEMEIDALLDKLRDHRMELATAAAAIKKETKTEGGEGGEDDSMDVERIPDGSQIEDYMDEKQKKISFLYDIPHWIEIDASVEIDDLEEMEKAKAKEQEDKIKLESEGEQEGEEKINGEKVSEEEDLSEFTPKTVTYEEVILQHYEARRERYAATTSRGAPTTYTAPCPRTARPVNVTLWGLSLTTRLHLPRTKENFPLHPSYASSVTYGDCYRAQCEATACSSNSSSSGSNIAAFVDSDPPPLNSNFSRISRILAQLPPQPPTEAPQDVSDATIAAGVAKLLQELPANIDMNMLQYYAKLAIEHVGKEAVSPNRRHLNAARRKHSLASEAVPNLPLPFFTAQDPMVYMMLLGPTLHSTGTTFYTTNSGTAGLKLLCPNHFPIHTIEPVGGDDARTKDMKSISSGSSLVNVSKAETSNNVGSILAVSLNAANDGTIQSVAVRRSARHAGGRRYT